MAEPHEAARFTNAAQVTVAITVTVAGGARPGTAHRRADTVVERITNAAARLADVVDVTAMAGPPGPEGEIVAPRRVRFAAANTGLGTYIEPDKLDRYLDPDHERALASLAAVHAAHRERRDADQDRRRAVTCLNTSRSDLTPRQQCLCVYCEPGRHLDTLVDGPGGMPFLPPRCICGKAVHAPAQRCPRHRDTQVIALPDDPEALRQVIDVSRDVR